MDGDSSAFTIDDLYEAFRKAKADVFFEKSQPLSLSFCKYESNLSANLRTLLLRLNDPESLWEEDPEFIGSFGFLPKGLRVARRKTTVEDTKAACHFSEANQTRAWKLLLDENTVEAEFRAVAHFTVDMYVVCALWVNTVGHKFDACLSEAARGSRLRRIEASEPSGIAAAFHTQALGSFRQYFQDYRSWRKDGLDAIRSSLELGEPVIALTMDLAQFYHRIDASFLLDSAFLKRIGFSQKSGKLSKAEQAFTQKLVAAFATWGRQLPTFKKGNPVGIPVGPSAPRVIANVLLAELDQLFIRELVPVYYGRYVDDIFLVIKDPGNLACGEDVLAYMSRRVEILKNREGSLELDLPYAASCKLEFKKEKQRIFMLSGPVGLDFIDTLESKIGEVSSEWRFLPKLDELEDSPAAKALTAARDSDVEADSLRKADTLSIKRLGLSILLRNLDSLSQDLPSHSWLGKRESIYEFMLAHVITPARLLDLNEYVPRLVSLATHCKDWDRLESIVKATIDAVDTLERDAITEANASQWNGYRKHLALSLQEAVLRSVPGSGPIEAIQKTLSLVRGIVSSFGLALPSTGPIRSFARQLRHRDLARVPLSEMILNDRKLVVQGAEDGDAPVRRGVRYDERAAEIRSFIKRAKLDESVIRPLLFPTRPLRPAEITSLIPECVVNVELLRKYTRALRGTWIKAVPQHANALGETPVCDIGGTARKRRPRICVTSFAVSDRSWARAASGEPDEAPERYIRLMSLVNGILSAESRPDYVLLPELSVPRRWLRRLVSRLLPSGISLIAGAEYERRDVGEEKYAVNEVKMFLTDDRLGYPTHVEITQRKGIPAHGERNELRRSLGVLFPAVDGSCDKRIYHHRGLYFGLLVCSELSDIGHRQKYVGGIDALFVLSWNRDLDSFSAMVESSALDLHCFMVLVNNRKYGDSRVRAPFREPWERELVRIRGGLDDYFVVTEIDVLSLREFQSYHESPEKGLFKPTPEGFQIMEFRKRIPGG